MILKQIIDEDFTNYQIPSLFIAFPSCSFKCEKECGVACCQNSNLTKSPNIDYAINKLVSRYINNIYTNAIVCGWLEPFDSWNDLLELITELRKKTMDDIVIYTGYNKQEIANKIAVLLPFKNIIIKFGRYIPNQNSHYDVTLGVILQSPNQYAERIC